MTSKPVIFIRESPELLGLCEKEILDPMGICSVFGMRQQYSRLEMSVGLMTRQRRLPDPTDEV